MTPPRNHLLSKIQLLNRLVFECVNSASDQEIVQKAVHTGIRILDADFGFSFLKPTNRYFSLVYRSPETPFVPKIPRKDGLTVKALSGKKPIFIHNVQKDGRIKDHPEKMRSAVIVPMVYQNRPIGTLHFCFSEHRRFFHEDGTDWLCELLGNSAAQAITIHGLYSRQKQNQVELARLVKEKTKKLIEANRKLQQERARDNALFTSLGEGIMATDEYGRVMLMNPEAENILGIRKNRVLEKSAFVTQKLYDSKGQRLDLDYHPLHKALQLGERLHADGALDLHVKRKNKLVPISITASPIKIKGRIVGAIEIFWDVSKEKEIDRVKSELVSLVSHQLRTPLSAINWYAEVLLKGELGQLNADQQRYTQEITNANRKMVELVYDFLNVSRMELGTFQVKLSDVNSEEVVESVLNELLAPEIRAKRLKVRKDISRLPVLRIDRKILRIVLQNLLSNSVKYTQADGEVSLSILLEHASNKQAKLLITVADNGFGIPEHQHGKVFTKLFRADNATAMETEGTGLGLYIVKSFVDYCGGNIRFKSKENKGSSFYVELPVEFAKVKQAQTR